MDETIDEERGFAGPRASRHHHVPVSQGRSPMPCLVVLKIGVHQSHRMFYGSSIKPEGLEAAPNCVVWHVVHVLSSVWLTGLTSTRTPLAVAVHTPALLVPEAGALPTGSLHRLDPDG